jgi:hypothetical protein
VVSMEQEILLRRDLGIVCYIKMNVSPHIWLHKIDPLNHYIWIEISYINPKNIYMSFSYFAPINSTFYKKKI